MAMYPQLCYYNWPNSAELLCMLLLLAGAAAAAALVLAATAAAPYAWRAPASASGMLQYCSVVCLTAAVGYKAVDLLLDVIRAFHPVSTLNRCQVYHRQGLLSGSTMCC